MNRLESVSRDGITEKRVLFVDGDQNREPRAVGRSLILPWSWVGHL